MMTMQLPVGCTRITRKVRQTKHQMLIGGIMMVLSWLVIFAMVLELLPQPIELYMIAYIISLMGLIIGMIGLGTEVRNNMRKHHNNE